MAIDAIKSAYQQLAAEYNLSLKQIEQLQTYAQLLVDWSERMNLTALLDPFEIITYHFKDSLEISRFMDFAQVQTLADIGTGAGFPAIPLKIMHPHLQLILIEVNSKRIRFLQEVMHLLDLTNITIVDLDWRTFLRKTDYSIDLFIARASLAPAELVRIFKAHSLYKHARLVYWAAELWQPDAAVAPYLQECYSYEVGARKRQYALFADTNPDR